MGKRACLDLPQHPLQHPRQHPLQRHGLRHLILSDARTTSVLHPVAVCLWRHAMLCVAMEYTSAITINVWQRPPAFPRRLAMLSVVDRLFERDWTETVLFVAALFLHHQPGW